MGREESAIATAVDQTLRHGSHDDREQSTQRASDCGWKVLEAPSTLIRFDSIDSMDVYSYDESLSIFDVRAPRNALVSIGTGGGVWRVKHHPFDASLILTASMHNGFHVFRVSDCARGTDCLSNTGFHSRWTDLRCMGPQNCSSFAAIKTYTRRWRTALIGRDARHRPQTWLVAAPSTTTCAPCGSHPSVVMARRRPRAILDQ